MQGLILEYTKKNKNVRLTKQCLLAISYLWWNISIKIYFSSVLCHTSRLSKMKKCRTWIIVRLEICIKNLNWVNFLRPKNLLKNTSRVATMRVRCLELSEQMYSMEDFVCLSRSDLVCVYVCVSLVSRRIPSLFIGWHCSNMFLPLNVLFAAGPQCVGCVCMCVCVCLTLCPPGN